MLLLSKDQLDCFVFLLILRDDVSCVSCLAAMTVPDKADESQQTVEGLWEACNLKTLCLREMLGKVLIPSLCWHLGHTEPLQWTFGD